MKPVDPLREWILRLEHVESFDVDPLDPFAFWVFVEMELSFLKDSRRNVAFVLR
jgi:hypothetical protein